VTRAAAAVVCAALFLAGCGNDDGADVGFEEATLEVPASLGGLSVQLEPEATKKLKSSSPKTSYVADGAVFALRQGDELRAVLQVAMFTADARPADEEFQKNIVSQIGSFTGKPTKVNNVPVYATEANEQVFYVWFKGRFFETLSVRKSESFVPAEQRVNVRQILTEAVSLNPQIPRSA
jgi:hypothetical protein